MGSRPATLQSWRLCIPFSFTQYLAHRDLFAYLKWLDGPAQWGTRILSAEIGSGFSDGRFTKLVGRICNKKVVDHWSTLLQCLTTVSTTFFLQRQIPNVGICWHAGGAIYTDTSVQNAGL